MKKSLSVFLLILLSCLLHAQNIFVFIGSYNYDKNKEGIYVYELDTITGSLTKVSSVKNILNPSFFTLSEDGRFLYSCTDTRTPKDGSVSSFGFNKNSKSLTFINSQKTGGENPVYVALDKNERIAVCANYNDGSVSVFSVHEDGTLAAAAQFIPYKDSSIHKTRQERSHIHAAVFSPDFKYVLLPDLGADKIRGYAFNYLQKQPLDTSQSAFAKTVSGSGPRHLSFHPNGKTAYCIEELSGTVSIYNYENGKLDNIQRITTHRKKYKGEFSSADIHLSPDGKFLYASNRGEENNIAIFSVQQNGKLKSIGYQSTFGKIPRNFCIDETGKFLIVANQSTGNIIVFKRNQETGLLQKTGNEIQLENPTCVRIKKFAP